MKILQIIEESPSLDFSIPFLEFVDDNKNEVLIFTTKPSYMYWFNHKPKELFSAEKNFSFSTSVDTLFLNTTVTRTIKYLCKDNRDNLNNIFSKGFRKILNLLINKYSNPVLYFERFFDGLPDCVLIDTRNDLDVGEMNFKIFNWIEENSIKTIGVPVSSYTIEGVKWGPITPFGKREFPNMPFEKFPSNYEYWMSSKQEFVIEQLDKTPYKIVGYPGLDLNYIELKNKKNENALNEVNILLNVRHFGKKRNIGPAAGKYIYEDVLNFFKDIKFIIDKQQNIKFNFYIKPHYYVNFKSFKKILKKIGITNYKFLRTSIYNALENIDLVIGMHSSVNLISILFNKPTLLYPQVLTTEMMRQDKKSYEMYSKLNGFSLDNNIFLSKFDNFLELNNRKKFAYEDRLHIRNFFQENSIESIINVLKID